MPTSTPAATSRSALRRLATLGVLGLSLVGFSGLTGLGTAVLSAPAVSAQPASLRITTTTVPDGTRGQPYPVTTLVATGGTRPYTWSAKAAFQPLPPGLSLSPQGVISGTPSAAGTYTFEVDVSDSASPPQSDFTFLTIGVHQGPHFAPGSVLAWGYDSQGQLGNPAFFGSGSRFGSDIDAPNPVTLPAGTVATAMSAGDNFGLALTTTGHVYAWGANNGGQLGVGQTFRTLRFSATPVEVCAVGGCANGPLSDVVAISAGGSYGLALTSSGQVLGWGFDNQGQVGNGTRNPAGITTPVPACAPGSTPDAGSCSTGPLSGIKAVSAGASGTSLALTDAGGVLAWGGNSNGQLGNGATGPLFGVYVPQPVCAPAGCAAGGLTGISAVSSGAGENEMALSSSGAVLAWGRNTFGQLGNGTTTDAHLPTPVAIPAGDRVTAISAGSFGALALTATKTVLSWGYVNGGTPVGPGLGNGDVDGSATPVALSLPPVAAVAAGDFDNSMVATTAGEVLSWGDNAHGQLGQDNGYGGQSLTPVPPAMPAGTVVSAVASGSLFNMALVQGPTTLTATAALHGGHPPFFLTATLTTGGAPVAGQTVVFTAGTTVLCTSVTDASGVATCNARTPTGIRAVAAHRGYTATFAGTPDYGPSQAAGPLVPQRPAIRQRRSRP